MWVRFFKSHTTGMSKRTHFFSLLWLFNPYFFIFADRSTQTYRIINSSYEYCNTVLLDVSILLEGIGSSNIPVGVSSDADLCF